MIECLGKEHFASQLILVNSFADVFITGLLRHAYIATPSATPTNIMAKESTFTMIYRAKWRWIQDGSGYVV